MYDEFNDAFEFETELMYNERALATTVELLEFPRRMSVANIYRKTYAKDENDVGVWYHT